MTTNDKWAQRDAADYRVAINHLLPKGLAWPRESDTVLQKVVHGLSGIWGGSVETLAALLLQTESDPRLANVLLADWEQAWGLPDQCIPIPSEDLDIRRTNLVTKMTFLGAQSKQFFIDQAEAIGQTITIREYAPYMCGVSRVGDTHDLNTDDDGKMRWQLGPPENRFYWTVSVTGLLTNWAGADIYCLLHRWKPAHTEVILDFSDLAHLIGSRPWNSGYTAIL
jgi:uncharacterized protein YmfQ (DUF2313 family)